MLSVTASIVQRVRHRPNSTSRISKVRAYCIDIDAVVSVKHTNK